MKRLVLLLAVVGLVAVVGARFGAGDERPRPADDSPPKADKADPKSFWMKKKLDYSKSILEGLANADFEIIGKDARAMNNLSQIEKWVRANTPEYRTQLRIFRFANEQLIEQADRENLDGASLAFVQLTLSCVNCHKVVRQPLADKNRPVSQPEPVPEK